MATRSHGGNASAAAIKRRARLIHMSVGAPLFGAVCNSRAPSASAVVRAWKKSWKTFCSVRATEKESRVMKNHDLVAFYQSRDNAERARKELLDAGFDHDDVKAYFNDGGDSGGG